MREQCAPRRSRLPDKGGSCTGEEDREAGGGEGQPLPLFQVILLVCRDTPGIATSKPHFLSLSCTAVDQTQVCAHPKPIIYDSGIYEASKFCFLFENKK